jgi:3-oxoacyl-[acyl-carrier-protein] synthase II
MGLGLGEGAAFLVLESEASAEARGATTLAELASWAVGSEAHHITIPEKEGTTAATLIQRALDRGCVSVIDLDYVNAHGTGTPLNDAMEAAALHHALGGETSRVLVSSCKGQIGHTLGASGAIEAAVTVMAVERGEVPPTGGLEDPDPACDLAHVMGTGRRAEVRAALSNSFGFGGTDTVLLFTRPSLFEHRPERLQRRAVVTGAATLGPMGLAGSQRSLEYTLPGAPPDPAPLRFEPREHFDLARARRMDRSSRLLTMSMQTALAESKKEGGAVGAIAGSAYGTVDASAEFVQRIYEKGARSASPLVFPNLVPSSAVGHAAIYLALRGLVLATADLGTTAEASFALACELIEAGEAPAMLAGSVEERSVITDRVLGPVCSGSASWTGLRTEGSSAVLIEEEGVARERGARPLCSVVFAAARRGKLSAGSLLPAPMHLPALVVLARRDDATLRALAETPWSQVPVVEVAPRAGNHEGLGGISLVAAVGAVASGRAKDAFVLGVAPDRWAAIILTR